jgi:hypothetical protein
MGPDVTAKNAKNAKTGAEELKPETNKKHATEGNEENKGIDLMRLCLLRLLLCGVWNSLSATSAFYAVK